MAPSVSEALRAHAASPVTILLVDTRDLGADELQSLMGARDSGELCVVLLVAESEPGAYLDLPVDRVLPRGTTSERLLATLDELIRPVRRGSRALPFDLSRRELECAQLVARGLSNRRIAELTGLREQSVKNVVSLAMRKLSVENRVQIALRLSQAGVSDTVATQAVVSISVPAAAGVAVD